MSDPDDFLHLGYLGNLTTLPELQLRCGFSVQQAADACFVSPETYRLWLRDRRPDTIAVRMLGRPNVQPLVRGNVAHPASAARQVSAKALNAASSLSTLISIRFIPTSSRPIERNSAGSRREGALQTGFTAV
ncbi:MAG: hypothetical protein U9Q81_06495 [Pseudomonadota bacterium]|nr:hypothetical protein [Pseudomonadota bacterium]